MTPVVVVGGAIAGSAVANAWGSRGADVVLIEKSRREVHSTRGDILHPSALRRLEEWDALDSLWHERPLPITELAVTDARRGLIARYPVQPQGPGASGRTIALPHDRIEAALRRRALAWPTVELLTGTVTGLIWQNERVAGVTLRTPGRTDETSIIAKLVVGCDGSRSLVRRQLGVTVDEMPYDHEQVIISGSGRTELPAALHWHIDDIGALCVVSRPNNAFRILLTLPVRVAGELLKRPDPALHQHVTGRFPSLAALEIRKANAHLYRLTRQIASTFAQPGAAIVGDAAHATHPAGATGMSLAIEGAAHLARHVAPVVLAGGSDGEVDNALLAYSAERQPAALRAVLSNHEQALRIWQSDLHRHPDEYAAAVDPSGGWGAGGVGWGRDPAAAVR